MKTDLDLLVLDVLRMALRGDVQAIRAYVRRMLRRPPAELRDRERFVRLLQALVDERAAPELLGSVAAPTRSPASRPERRPVDLAQLAHSDVLSWVGIPAAPTPILAPAVEKVIRRIVDERRRLPELEAAGLHATRSVLFTGPPGVGKTMTARFLAAQLQLPLVVLDLAAVVSSYLGKTGQNLQAALEVGQSGPCVLLLDEFDALAKRRDDVSDIGELKRIVNVLLVEIERWPAQSLLVAATNHPRLLDPAIWRRFDVVVDLGLPDAAARVELIANAIAETPLLVTPVVLELAAAAAVSVTPADIGRMARNAAREAVLAGNTCIDDALLREFATFVAAQGRTAQTAFAKAAIERDMSRRQVAELLGITHPTVTRMLAPPGERPAKEARHE